MRTLFIGLFVLTNLNLFAAEWTIQLGEQKIQLTSEIENNPLILECDDRNQLKQVKLKYLVERRCRSLSCHLDNVADLISGNLRSTAELDQLGLPSRQVSDGESTYKIYEAEIEYKYRARFKLVLEDRGLDHGVKLLVKDKRRQSKVAFRPAKLRPLLPKDIKASIDQGFVKWRKDLMPSINMIASSILHNRELSFNATDYSEMLFTNLGQIEREINFSFCGKKINIPVVTTFEHIQ